MKCFYPSPRRLTVCLGLILVLNALFLPSTAAPSTNSYKGSDAINWDLYHKINEVYDTIGGVR